MNPSLYSLYQQELLLQKVPSMVMNGFSNTFSFSMNGKQDPPQLYSKTITLPTNNHNQQEENEASKTTDRIRYSTPNNIQDTNQFMDQQETVCDIVIDPMEEKSPPIPPTKSMDIEEKNYITDYPTAQEFFENSTNQKAIPSSPPQSKKESLDDSTRLSSTLLSFVPVERKSTESFHSPIEKRETEQPPRQSVVLQQMLKEKQKYDQVEYSNEFYENELISLFDKYNSSLYFVSAYLIL